MRHLSLALAAALLLGGCEFIARTASPEPKDAPLTEGANGWLSPDGRELAFQRHMGLETWLGILNLDTKKITWVEKGPGRAAFPFWAKSGMLLYSSGNLLHTAYENLYGPYREGYNIRGRKDGMNLDILPRGRHFDLSPALANDGHTLWFVTSREEQIKEAHQIHSSIARIDLNATNGVEYVYTPREGHPCGVSQVAVSPDGRHVVWGELPDVHATWGLKAVRADDFSRIATLTPPDLAAYSPNFSPDGRLIAFTGYREGDPGWSVYLLDPARRAFKRLCRGENPSFAPDGKSIIYDRDETVRLRRLEAGDMPTDADALEMPAYRLKWTKNAEKVVWHGENLGKPEKFPLAQAAAVGRHGTVFMRAKVTLDPDGKGHRGIASLRYKDCGVWLNPNGYAFTMYVDDKDRAILQVGNAIRWGAYVWSRQKVARGVPQTVTAIRSDGMIWVSVNDAPADSLPLAAGQCAFDEAEQVCIGHPFSIKGNDLMKVEVGVGWPNNVPKPHGYGAYDWEDVK